MTKRRNLATSRKKKEYFNRPPFDLPMGFFKRILAFILSQKISFYPHANFKTHFHSNGCAQSKALMKRLCATRKKAIKILQRVYRKCYKNK